MGYKIIRVLVIFTILVCFFSAGRDVSYAAVGCTLNDPDRDARKIFPESTGYRTDFITIKERDGEDLRGEIEQKLGDKLNPIYESIDVPYAYYTILKGKKVIGRIHGVNQKGLYGGMQLILATDPDGRIKVFYYQKISSPESKKFRSKSFTDQLKGLTLADFYKDGIPDSPVTKIKDPSEKNSEDFQATIRGIKKNLILLDQFMLDNKYDEVYNLMERGKHEK